MDREHLFVVLGLSLLSLSLPAGAFLASTQRPLSDLSLAGDALERAAARRLLLPLLPTLLMLSALVGWVLQEPPIAERPPWFVFLMGVPGVIACSRAAFRAVVALRPATVRAAATLGIVNRRIVVDREFAASLDESARAAMMAHERAHFRHHDPLRLWIAQILTDLQWPLPGARERLEEWRVALELARDDEARQRVDGADLAAAVICAARLGVPHSTASLGGVESGGSLRARIHRLLAPLPESAPERALLSAGFALLGAVFASLLFGVHFGEDAVYGLCNHF